MAKRIPTVGVIAEDDCDVDSVKVLIHRIAENEHIGIKRCVGKGCGRIRKKCNAWAEQLKRRGCSLLVLIHDLDDNDINDLRGKIQKALNPCPISIHLICIPVQAIEAWLLCDPKAIQTAMHLENTPNVKAPPETINGPKNHLGGLIYRASNREKVYINTKHNSKIAEEISIKLARSKCPSFVPFYAFVKSNFNA
jgi:hypothetical protein